MPAIRDFAVTEVTTAVATATQDMPEHESGDILVVFANKDSTTGMTETTGLYTLLNSGDITTTAWSGMWWRRATSNNETPPTFTWTSETANFVIVAVKNVHPTNNPTAYLSSDDSTIPFTQNQSISTPSINCLVLHGIGTDTGIGVEPYPSIAQIIYAGDAGANGIGVSWAFYPSAGSIGNPTFWGWNVAPTQIHTIVIEDDGNNTEVQGYVDRGIIPCTIVTPLVGATLFGWAHQTSVSPLVVGNDFSFVWAYNATGPVWTDETVDMNDVGTADVALFTAVNSALYLGSNTKFSKFGLNMSTASSGGTAVWEYWNGSAWTAISIWTDYLTATGAHSYQWTPPTNWTAYDVNGQTYYWVRLRVTSLRTTAGVLSQGQRDGAGCGYDAITAGADLGVNPYHNVAQITQTSHAYNLVGNEILYSGGIDLSSGYLLFTFGFTSPRDWVDLSFLARLGIVIHMMDTSNNSRTWIVGAKDGKTTFSDRRGIFAIQVDETENSFLFSKGSLNAALIDTIGFFCVQPYGAMSINFSMLMITGTIRLAGGKSAFPLDFDKMIDAIINGVCLFPMLYKVGSVATVWNPLQIGGGDPLHISINLRTFEFPRHYDYDNKILDYHVDALQNGIEFYGKNGDTVKFTNCLFTSISSYYWRINASASSGASWDFSGTIVVKAQVTLKNIMTFLRMSFIDCQSIDASDCILSKCKISGAPAVGSGLTVNGSSVISECEIDTISIDAGNSFMQTATPEDISDCIFNGAINKGHAIRITLQGTYTFDGNKFNNYGADGTTSAAIFNDSGGLVTLNITGGGDTPTVRNGAGASTVINNIVTLIVRGVKSGNEPTKYVRCAIYRVSDGYEIMNKDASVADDQNPTYYKASESWTQTGIQVKVRARETGYLPFEVTVTVPASGLDIKAVWIVDPNYTP